MNNQFFARFLLLFALPIFVASCARNPVTGKKEVMLMSESQEINMGKSYDPQIVAQQGVYEDEKLQAFINEKGKAMAAKSHRPNLPYEFKIVDSPVVNAFAVPGGFVYFTRGIMAHFNNEAEFAGVLGHEIGHVTARHSAKQYSKQMLMQGLFIGGMIASEEFRKYGKVASQGMQLLSLKFGRDNESESDVLGVEYSTAIGYDAVEMADFFKTLTRLSESRGQSIPTFLSTHPNPANRFAKVKQMARQKQAIYAGEKFAVNRDQYLRMIDGIVYGEDPRQGYVENGMFYHPVLKFQFPVPSDWLFNNMPIQVQMAPKDKKALVTMTLAQGTDLQAVARKLIQEGKLNVIENSSDRVNGLPAIGIIGEHTPAAQNGQQATPLRVLIYLIKYNDMIYQFQGMATRADFNAYFDRMRKIMGGFKPLSDPSKLNRKPDVVKIVTVKTTGSLQQTLASFGMESSKLNDLAILNGMELTDTVNAGMLIKIVVPQEDKPVKKS